MNYQNFLIDALAIVDSWELEDSAISFAIAAQACLMSHVGSDEIGVLCLE